jgi:RNA polymerase sigma-70 factor (ECF subfamily)
MLQIVRSAAYAYFKKQRSRMEVPLVDGLDAEEDGLDWDIPDSDPGPEIRLMHRQELNKVEKELNALPAVLRECIVLREMEELSYKEIALLTGVPIGTVMSRLSRARQTLHKACAETEYETALQLDRVGHN